VTENIKYLPAAQPAVKPKRAGQRPQSVRLLRDGAPGLWLVMGLSIGVNLLILVSPIYTLEIFDRVLPTHNIDTLIYLTILALFLMGLLGAFDGLRQSVLSHIANWWTETNRPLAFETVLRLTRTGQEPQSDPMIDIQTVRVFLSGQTVVPLFDAPWVPFFVVAIWVLHPLLGMLALGSAIILFCLALLTDRVGRKPTLEAAARQTQLDRTANNYLRGADPVSAMGMESTLVERQEELQLEQTRVLQRAVATGALISGISKAVRISVQMMIMGLGAYLVVRQQLTSGGMIGASFILGRALAPVESMIGTWRTMISARDANRRVVNLFKNEDRSADQLLLPAPRGEVTARGLRYDVRGLPKPIINGVSIDLNPGTVTGIVGPSGSGKSTLCRLLVGSATPTMGSVRIDGADLKDWHPDQIGPAIGYVSQGYELFAGTIRDNIARFREDATDEEVVDAAIAAGCHELILQLPQGYASQVGDGGRFLSAGQRQRVSLGRALFRAPKLLVLDEPNAALDAEGENLLAETVIARKNAGATILLVTHRPGLLRAVDRIAVMRDGRIEALDARDVILQRLNQPRQAPPRPTVVENPNPPSSQASAG
jgi:PrtD family type I secretion system ABC transporter